MGATRRRGRAGKGLGAQAARLAHARSTRLRAHVEDRLAMGWSPEQIARADGAGAIGAQAQHGVHLPSRLQPRGTQGRAAAAACTAQATRGAAAGRRGTRVPIPDRVSIDARPAAADLRSELGHWEGDLMLFRKDPRAPDAAGEALGLMLARRLHGKDAQGTARAIVAELGTAAAAGAPNPHARQRRRVRQARACHRTDERQGLFCDPGCPGQRGSIENTHGRLRAPLPRRTNLAEISDAEIADWSTISTRRPGNASDGEHPSKPSARGLEAELRHGFTVALGT